MIETVPIFLRLYRGNKRSARTLAPAPFFLGAGEPAYLLREGPGDKMTL
jgi:hypothetical protein